jgi:8-oxo-dGTP pyrophosphatase MutT (NUDIX family)
VSDGPDPAPRARTPRVRATARVLVVDGDERLLLFRTHWNNRVAPPRWLTVGGGVDPGESTRDAAARELFEETGRRVPAAELGDPVWHERRPLPVGHDFDEVDATYYLWRTERFEPSSAHWMPDEFDDILGSGWFDVDELRASGDAMDPEDPARLLEMVLGTDRPAAGEPVLRAHTKWDGGPHWRVPSTCLGSDGHGVWLGVAIGSTLARPGLQLTAPRRTVMLVPHTGGWTTTFHRDHPGWRGEGPLHSYTDIVTPPRWFRGPEGWVATATDLDLDVVATERRVFVDDEDEFDEHRVAFGYPDEVVTLARASCAWVAEAVLQERAPFDGASSGRWLRLLADPAG